MLTMYFAFRDPRVPFYVKAIMILVVVYAISPIDLIPDFIPVSGYLDDLIIVPLGVMLALKLIPEPILADCRNKAASLSQKPRKWSFTVLKTLFWFTIVILLIILVYHISIKT